MVVYDSDRVLKILALTIGTTTTAHNTPTHHLTYLVKKLMGLDSLGLDDQNTELYNKIKEVFEGFNKWIPNYTQEI